jgi:hypothetical protein
MCKELPIAVDRINDMNLPQTHLLSPISAIIAIVFLLGDSLRESQFDHLPRETAHPDS